MIGLTQISLHFQQKRLAAAYNFKLISFIIHSPNNNQACPKRKQKPFQKSVYWQNLQTKPTNAQTFSDKLQFSHKKGRLKKKEMKNLTKSDARAT